MVDPRVTLVPQVQQEAMVVVAEAAPLLLADLEAMVLSPVAAVVAAAAAVAEPLELVVTAVMVMFVFGLGNNDLRNS